MNPFDDYTDMDSFYDFDKTRVLFTYKFFNHIAKFFMTICA